jgi:hypothetical protein
MKNSWRTACVALGTGMLLAVGAFDAGAQASVYLECSTSDICGVDITTDPGTPTPLSIQWTFQIPYGADPIFKNCTNKTGCSFYCPRHPGTLTTTVTVKDANGATLGTDSQSVRCTLEQEP